MSVVVESDQIMQNDDSDSVRGEEEDLSLKTEAKLVFERQNRVQNRNILPEV